MDIASAAGVQSGRVQAFGNALADATIANNSSAATVASIRLNEASNNVNTLTSGALAEQKPKSSAAKAADAARNTG